MLYLIGYDVNTTSREGRKRLTKVAKICCNYGQRVQNSLFECSLDGSKYVDIKKQLLTVINESEDSLRIYHLGAKYDKKIEHFGTKQTYNPEGILVF